MEWTDQGIVLSVKPHGETSAVLEVLTAEHGRHAGLVKGGRSKRNRPVLQTGNLVSVVWKARLAEHLGQFNVELIKSNMALLMDDRLALAGVSTLSALSHLLPEREPQRGLYDAFMLILDYVDEASIWPTLLVRWEVELLNELGFGLDLSVCAATGSNADLKYVSPKSGRAVSGEAGEPYKDRLLVLPGFLVKGTDTVVSKNDILNAFELTGYFLERHIYHARNLPLPDSRERLISYLEQSSY